LLWVDVQPGLCRWGRARSSGPRRPVERRPSAASGAVGRSTRGLAVKGGGPSRSTRERTPVLALETPVAPLRAGPVRPAGGGSSQRRKPIARGKTST
jgi:hypothetical protein